MTTISSKLFSFSSFLILITTTTFISQTKAQPTFYPQCSNDRGNYTLNSTYQNNLNTLLSNLISNTEITYGFYNFSYGQDTNKVYAIGLCRGDVNPGDCRTCLNDSKLLLTQNCPNQKEAIGWTDHCMLRYSNRSIFNDMESLPGLRFWNPNNATNVAAYNKILGDLLRDIREKAAKGDSRVKYATRNATGPNFQDIYGLMQCTPDLSGLKCDECLAGAISDLSSCCVDKVGGRVIGPSCNIRYESYLFYERTTAEVPPPLPTLSSNNNTFPPAPTPGKGNTSRTVIVIAVPIVVVVVLVLCFTCIYLRLKKPREIIRSLSEETEEIETNESLQFNFDTIRVATNDFSDSNKLGQGGFGAVYQGKLPNGQLIAVKRLSMSSGQGDVEFKNEVLLVAKLQHRNLVRLTTTVANASRANMGSLKPNPGFLQPKPLGSTDRPRKHQTSITGRHHHKQPQAAISGGGSGGGGSGGGSSGTSIAGGGSDGLKLRSEATA